MAKLPVVFAVLFAAALVTLASATTYTTVVTTTVSDENPQQSCQSEIQQRKMSHCMQWMQSKMGRRGSFEDSFLRSAVANPRYQEEHLQECCSELNSVSERCVCDAIGHMMSQMKPYGTEEEMMKESAQSLPRMCNISLKTPCRF